MTIRLVALMSVILLLSLAAFGLVVNHYQDQVMQEVAKTASAVGQATLRTFEFQSHHGNDEVSFGPEGAGIFVWESGVGTIDLAGNAEAIALATHGELTDSAGPNAVIRPFGEGKPEIEVIERLNEMDVVRRRLVATSTGEEGEVVVRCELDAATGEEDCTTTRDGETVEGGNRFFVRIDDVHAESDPAEGLVLKIPRFLEKNVALREPATAGTGHAHESAVHFDSALEEIKVPISDDPFRDLFARLRQRSLFLFLGVFLVGTALSAGVAARFTRPIRRLDSGLRRLSEGDLEARVDVRGHDEVARLGGAFNEMTRKLRDHRERSREMTRREKLSAIGRLAAGVAHDVRNPLHSIGLTLQHLQEAGRPEGGERAVEFDRSVEIIRGEIRRLDQLVANFLRFTASEAQARQLVDLGELLDETVRLIKKEAEWRNVEVQLDVDDDVPQIAADGEALRSSILNLVLNSFEAMPDGGQLVLRLRAGEGEVSLEVADDGVGIDPEEQERVFEFAYTTREGGNGLGLAMVHQCVVEEHGGRVSLESRPGEGTRVTLALPRTPGDGEAA